MLYNVLGYEKSDFCHKVEATSKEEAMEKVDSIYYECINGDECIEFDASELVIEYAFEAEKPTLHGKFALCANRHQMPEGVTDVIFPEVVPDVTDVYALGKMVDQKLGGQSYGVIDLYVTGLTVCLIEVIKWCHDHGVILMLYHYNRDTGTYFPQHV